jgi:hypothetical protein
MYSKGLAYLLWFLSGFGCLGFHRFYLGKTLSGFLWAFTGGLFGFGALYDLFTLSGQVDEENMRRALLHNLTGNRDNQGWRYVKDGSSHIVQEKDGVERTVLKMAKKNKGIVTPSELALEANIPLDEAKRHLEKMYAKGHAEMRVRKSGVIVFTFPEFMDDDSGFEDF